MPLENLKTTDPVVAVRSERGFSATNYDASVANPKKTLRRQFGQKYDVKKVRNTYAYLREVLTKLPSMTNWQIKDVTPEAYARALRERQRPELRHAS